MSEKQTVPSVIDLSILAAKKPLLVSTYTQAEPKNECEDSLNELERLLETLGIPKGIKEACPLRQFNAATYLGSGKVEELVELSRKNNCDLIVIDDELPPAQQRNLENLFQRPVVDRTEIILEVFAQHAKSREAKLQIEVAQIRYQLPRLKRLWSHLSRQRGGGVNQKGEGEQQLEIDKRLLRKKFEGLQKELEQVQLYRNTQRRARERSGIATFAIVGYTNSGKSTLLKALTEADVLIEDKLFATLDTTTRKYCLPNHQEILLIDTVGFIKKLPHTLVAAFRSTLQEAMSADILLHLMDASSPLVGKQAEATLSVLKELGAQDKPIITLFNKAELVKDPLILTRLRLTFPKSVTISALKKEGFDLLLEYMERELSERRKLVHLRVPQKDYHIVAEIERRGLILTKEFDNEFILIKAELPHDLAQKLLPYRIES
ncbi:MAG: GTPase HflX [Chlamydiae bacterium]|nr:GTPase HflX [Chlamydiota bacterium]